MSQPTAPTPVELHELAAVTGGTTILSSSNNDLLNSLTTLQSTLQSITSTANQSGFSTTEVLMLGLLLSQSQSRPLFFVQRPFW